MRETIVHSQNDYNDTATALQQERQTFLNAMASTAAAVNIVTTDGKAGRYGQTVSAFTSVSAEPPIVLVCINRHSPARNAILNNEIFSVNVLNSHQVYQANQFAGQTKDAYQFDQDLWHKAYTGIPVLKDALCVFECEVNHACESGTHSVFYGRVVKSIQGEGTPLIYSNRSYSLVTPWQ